MRVRVLYFGVLKERFGATEEVVELADGASGDATVGELVRVLRERSSNSERTTGSAMASETDGVWASVAVAVNREYAAADAVLREGDEVALLPPVSGGSFADGERRVPRTVADRTTIARAMLAAEILRWR